LLDAYTIYKQNFDFKSISIAIVGDVLRSRVARSQVEIFQTLGVKDIRLVVPKVVSLKQAKPGTQLFNNLLEGVSGVNVIIALRGQLERMNRVLAERYLAESTNFIINEKVMAYAASNVILMHPGPMNSGDEIDRSLINDKRCLVLQQVEYGVAVRMALLEMLFHVKH